MNITKGQTYVLIETAGGLLIVDSNAPLPQMKLEKLVAADNHDLAAYLVRYLAARQQGLNLEEAHKAALADAVVLRPGEQEAKGKLNS